MDPKDKFNEIINDPALLGKSRAWYDPRRIRDSLVGAAYKRMNEKAYDKRLEKVIDKKPAASAALVDAVTKGDPSDIRKATAGFSSAFREGPYSFSSSVNTKFMNEVNGSITSSVGNFLFFGNKLSETEAAKRTHMANLGLRAGPLPRDARQITRGNSVFKMGAAMMGVSPGKAAAGLALGTAGIFGAGALMGYSPPQTASGIGTAFNTVNEVFKQGARPTYGSSQMGQSTQGLTFGLHNRRTR